MPIRNHLHLRGQADGSVIFLPNALRKSGPMIGCEVRIDSGRAELLQQGGQAVPPGVPGQILIDTGAASTCIDQAILDSLGIPPVGVTSVQTPTSREDRKVYPCGLGFPGSNIPSIPSLFVIGCDLSGQKISGLLGRDVLAEAVFIYNGVGGFWTLTF